MPATPVPNPYYQYAAGYLETARATGIERTKTVLLLIPVGFFIGWIPLVGVVGGIPELVGGIMVILGRHAFGREHARNVMWSNHYFHNSDSSGNCSCVRHCLFGYCELSS